MNLNLQLERRLHSLTELQSFALDFARLLSPGMLVGFKGDLGAGKTTLISFLCKELGAKQPVSSPSYVLQQIYTCKSGLEIEHWDLYRLRGAPQELFEAIPVNTIRLVEWFERAETEGLIPDLIVTISLLEDGSRELSVFSSPC